MKSQKTKEKLEKVYWSLILRCDENKIGNQVIIMYLLRKKSR